ncbi:MAG: site-specific integrase [Candidatus Woesearchaeota archaeon]
MKRRDDLRYLTYDEWERLIASVDSLRDILILRLLYETGCTVNELVHIKIKDIDFHRHTVKIHAENSRNHEFRETVISPKLAALIREFASKNIHSEFLLYTRQSKSMTTKRIRQIVQQRCVNVGIENANPQTIRYTHIAHAYQKSVPVDAIIRQVGLKRSRAIQIFSQLSLIGPRDAYKKFLA